MDPIGLRTCLIITNGEAFETRFPETTRVIRTILACLTPPVSMASQHHVALWGLDNAGADLQALLQWVAGQETDSPPSLGEFRNFIATVKVNLHSTLERLDSVRDTLGEPDRTRAAFQRGDRAGASLTLATVAEQLPQTAHRRAKAAKRDAGERALAALMARVDRRVLREVYEALKAHVKAHRREHPCRDRSPVADPWEAGIDDPRSGAPADVARRILGRRRHLACHEERERRERRQHERPSGRGCPVAPPLVPVTAT